MKGRQAAIVLGAFLGALGTQGLSAGDNDRAVPRGGGGGGGSHGGGSATAARQPSGGSSHGGSYSGPSSSASRGPQTAAQRRQPVPGQGHYGHGHGGYYGRHGGYYGGYGYYGRYYPYSYWPYWGWGYGYYSPWYYPYYGGYYAGFGYPYYGGHVGVGYSGGGGGAYYDGAGSVRVIVEPRETKVYVDEYYAGVADDFDGVFQRLNVRPGRHDITLKLDGFETHKVKLYAPVDHTLKIRHKMVRGAADKVTDETVGDPADGERYARRPTEEREYDRPESEDRVQQPREREREQPQAQMREGEQGGDDSWTTGRERGALRLDVSPADASIYVDGMFRGTGQDLRRLSLPPGRHRLEVVRPGYRTLERDVEVRAGETEQVDVDLTRS